MSLPVAVSQLQTAPFSQAATRVFPSGVKDTEPTALSCSPRQCSSAKVSVRQSRTPPPASPDATVLQSDEKLTAVISCRWFPKHRAFFLLPVSQTCRVLSRLPETMVRASGEIARHVTSSLCPPSEWISFPVATSQK